MTMTPAMGPVAVMTTSNTTALTISELADSALYEAKDKGRNTFAIARLAMVAAPVPVPVLEHAG